MAFTVTETILERVPCYILGTDSKVRLISLVDLRLAIAWEWDILVELPVTIH